ncbi:MAG TPA: G1 family glutamic endopeptidase [Rhabdochlamydiaceae bacterium]|nr:G1 family glutamic endopeptidase [Rhabdochlamydiaceae bacterium]
MKKEIASLFVLLLTSVSGWSMDESQMTEIKCSVKPIDRSKIHPKEAFGQAVSSNWSGYVSSSNFQQPVPGSVSYAAGDWIVPTLSSTPDDSYCAIWVGIDGYSDGTVEQLGTSHNWISGAQQNYAWFEMYPNGSFEINGFPCDNGDEISVRIGYKGNDYFKMVMFNHTKGVFTTIPASYTTSSGTVRNSAEWVVEAPFSGSILPLSDFRVATLNYCSAIINGVQGSISDPQWMNDSINMENTDGTVKAVTSDLSKNGNSFFVSWEHE